MVITPRFTSFIHADWRFCFHSRLRFSPTGSQHSVFCVQSTGKVNGSNYLFTLVMLFVLGWWHGIVVTHCVESTKLLYTRPG